MPLIVSVPEPNLWDQICKEFAAERPPFPELKSRSDREESSVSTEVIEFDPAKHSPVFYGQLARQEPHIDCDGEFDPAVGHPAAASYCFMEKPQPKSPSPPPPPPDKKTCSPREYLQHYIFPILTPALEYMLQRAKEEKCFQRRRTAFNALDCLTEYLYSKNPNHTDREGTALAEIPFVRDWWKDHPRAPLPKSLLWSDEEAVLVIQSHYRGYCVRRTEPVKELRQWQREWRDMNRDARERVNDFWQNVMRTPDDEKPPAKASTSSARPERETSVTENEGGGEVE